MNNIRDVLISMDNNPVRKTTDPYNLKDKVKEYINLANENITTEMDTESRYQALKGLYCVIDEENGSYVDEIKEASDPAVVKFLRRKNLNVEPREHGTGKALKNFIKYAKLAMCEATEVSNIGERHFFELEMDWKPQDGVWPAPAMLYALMDAIRWDGEYLWKQTKITTGKIMPKFWEKSNYFDKLNDEIRVAGEEAKQKAKEFFPNHFAGVAPDGRMVVGYSDEIQKLQEAQKSKVTIHKMTREEEMELIHEMVEEDRFWVAQPGKKVSRQGLYNSVENYIDDITDYLRKANNSISFDDDIIVFRALRNILAEMIHDNGGYALNDIKIDSLLEDMGYPTEKNYGFRELLDYVQDRMYEGIDCWWVTKNKNGITNGEIVFTLLLHELATEVALKFRKLQRTGKLTEEDKKPLWEPIAGITFEDNILEFQENKMTDRKQSKISRPELITHLLIDGKKAKMLYNALSADDVDWLVDKEKYDETSFANSLTSIPTGEKIKLHQVCQIYYVTKKVLFHDKARLVPEEWALIRQLFDAEDGKIGRVNTAYKKHVKNQENFDKHMGISGRIAKP